MKRRLGAAASLAMLLLCQRIASAQPAEPPPNPPAEPGTQTSKPDVARAQKLHATGKRFYEQGDYQSALEAFEQAYEAAPRPNLLLSRASAHRKLFAASQDKLHKQRAVELYRAFLKSSPKGELAVAATEALEALGPLEDAPAASSSPTSPEPSVAPAAKPKTTLAIDCSADGALISIDGDSPRPAQRSAVVIPGRHSVRVTAPGYATREVTVQAIADQITPETVELKELDATVDLGSDGASRTTYVDGRLVGNVRTLSLSPGRHFVSVTAQGSVSQGKFVTVRRGEALSLRFDEQATAQRYAGITLLSLAGATVAAGAVSLGFALERDGRAADLEAELQGGSIGEADFAAYQSLQEERDLFRTAGFVTLGVGAGIAALGLTLVLVDQPSPLPPPASNDAPRAAPPRALDELTLSSWVTPQSLGLCARATY